MTRDNATFWKVLAGVVAGTLIAGLVSFFVRMWWVEHTLRQISERTTQAAQRMQAQQREALERVKAEQETKRREAEERRQAERSALAEQQRADEQRRRDAIEASTQKEEAWSRFYKRPKRCENPLNNEVLVECANEHIRAKRQFEKLYSEGKL